MLPPDAVRQVDPDRTATLVAEVAAVIPSPGAALLRDDAAWTAFTELVDEAAGVLAAATGSLAAPELRTLLDSPLGAQPVTRLLLERALTRL